MAIEIGSIQEGKITGIMNFGAFVSLPGGKSGLVHISEISNTFVKDIHDHLQVGQSVRVKVLDITEQGKINLSIKRAQAEKREEERETVQKPPAVNRSVEPEPGVVAPPSGDLSFEEKLKKFM